MEQLYTGFDITNDGTKLIYGISSGFYTSDSIQLLKIAKSLKLTKQNVNLTNVIFKQADMNAVTFFGEHEFIWEMSEVCFGLLNLTVNKIARTSQNPHNSNSLGPTLDFMSQQTLVTVQCTDVWV